MLKNRIIPCLDVKNGRVVKGINFVDLVDAGDPVEQAKIYDEQGADELCFLDITASNENRNIIFLCSFEAVISKKHSSSAPCSSYIFACSTGSPASTKSIKLIPLTTLPFFTSKQGIILFFNILN